MMSPLLRVWGEVPSKIADFLVDQLTHESRVYHSIHHINRLMIDVDRYCASTVPQQIFWAILYHDVVYDPLAHSGNNEEASAQVWEAHFDTLYSSVRGFKANWKAQVSQAIRATKNHFDRGPDLQPWQHEFLDLDLVSLGAPKDVYRADGLMIRQEYIAAGVTEEQFRTGRIAFLRNALTDPHIYYALFQEDQRAAQAAKNMLEEQQELLAG